MLRNIFEEVSEPLLQRRVSYDNVGADGVTRLRHRVRSAAETFLRRIDALFAKYDRDRNPKAPGGERNPAGLGVYYFESPHPKKTARTERGKPPPRGDEESTRSLGPPGKPL